METQPLSSNSNSEASSVARLPELSIREVLTPRVITAIINYSLLAYLDIALRALQPLFYTTSIPLGGLGFDAPLVGLCLGAFGLFSGLYQAFVFSPVYDRFGTKKIFVTSILTFVPMFGLFPLMNLSARKRGVDAITWAELTIQMVLYVLMDMGFSISFLKLIVTKTHGCTGCAFIYIRSAAPNSRSLGATNGLAQTCVSVVRAIGPAASTSLFAVSLQRNILRGNFVYVIMVLFSIGALYATTYLPRTLWQVPEENDQTS
jgi:hypothetical protein